MNIKEKRSCFTIADKKYQLKLALSIGIITYTEYKKRMYLINSKNINYEKDITI